MTWTPCRVGGSNPTVDKMFCNVHLFRVPRSWTGSIQMKSSMKFIRGNRCKEREKDNFKNGGDVKRLKECKLALNIDKHDFDPQQTNRSVERRIWISTRYGLSYCNQ